jgi:hypothetical protein
MPVVVLADSTIPMPNAATGCCFHPQGESCLIASQGSSLTKVGDTVPGTLLTLLAMHAKTLAETYPLSMKVTVTALQACGQVHRSCEKASYRVLDDLRRQAGLSLLNLRFIDLDDAMVSSSKEWERYFPRLFSNPSCWSGLWKSKSGLHVRDAVASDFREDVIHWLEDQLHRTSPSEHILQLCIFAGWNCDERHFGEEVRIHAALSQASTLGSLVSVLKSFCTNQPPSLSFLGEGPRISIHQDWVPLLDSALEVGFAMPPKEPPAPGNVIFVLTVDPEGLGAEARSAWEAAGFAVELVSGELPLSPSVVRDVKKRGRPARLAWTLSYIHHVYTRTMSWPDLASIFLAEDSARPAEVVTFSCIRAKLEADSALAYWLGYRSLKKERTTVHSSTILPGGLLCPVPSTLKDGFPIGSKFFAVSRPYLRTLFVVALQLSPCTYQDHVHGLLVASGLLKVHVPSLCTSCTHWSNQDKRVIQEDDACNEPGPGLKLPSRVPFDRKTWSDASMFMTNRKWLFEPLLGGAKVVRTSQGSGFRWQLEVCSWEDGNVGWSLNCKGELAH